MSKSLLEALLEAIAGGAGILFVYFWIKGGVAMLAAKQHRLDSHNSVWLEMPFKVDLSRYYGAGKDYALKARHSWHRAMACAMVGVLCAAAARFVVSSDSGSALHHAQTGAMIRVALLATAVVCMVAFVVNCRRVMTQMIRRKIHSESPATGVGGEALDQRANGSLRAGIAWALLSLVIAVLATLALVGRI